MKYSNRLQTKTIAFFFLASILWSCNSNDCCIIIDNNIQLHYKNEVGENLINSSPVFNESEIKIYYKNGMDYNFAFNSNLDNPNMYSVYLNHDGKLLLSVFLSNIYEGTQSTTVIEINESISDTVVAEFNLQNGQEIFSKLWFNGIESDDRLIEVIR